ncbi:glycosyltransferase [Massilia sp. TSP1-1-2]|uniref:glycosyltransferase n=1 Tax=unclassified Massilia TaxID=2609279 RepID=UPI003CE672CF
MHLVDITMFYAAEGGGVSTYLNAKGRWLAQRDRVRHSILSPNVASVGQAPALVGVPGLRLPGMHGYRWPLSVGGTARIIARLQPDLIEAGDAGPGAWAALRAKRRLGVPAVAYYHSDLHQLMYRRFGRAGMGVARRYLIELYSQFDMVLAPSRLMVQQLGSMGVAGAIHQPLGIDVGTFSPRRRVGTLRQHLRLAPDARLLVYAGRFTHEKKLGLLIDAVRKLGRPYHLLLVGGGCITLPHYPQTSFIPFKRDQRSLARLLASCDVMVHPGDCETFGLIVLEAMACGLPVVATTSGGIAELVDEHTGILVPPNSVAGLCAGIEAIYQCDLEQLSLAAAARAHDHYDWNAIMPQLMSRYAGLLASRERADLQTEGFCVPE